MIVALFVLAPVFQQDGWPGEGKPRFAAKGGTVTLHAQPDASSPVTARVATKKDAPVAFEKSVVLTIKPGKVQATRDAWLRADTKKRYAFNAGDAFDYLQYAGEGGCYVRIGGEIVLTEPGGCDWRGTPEKSAFKVIDNPVIEWWIKIGEVAKYKGGWLKVDEADLISLPREF